jgi:hypothetical protein
VGSAVYAVLLVRFGLSRSQAREQLQTKWKQFTPSEKSECNQEADTDGISSYVELQICLEMEREVRQAQVGKM